MYVSHEDLRFCLEKAQEVSALCEKKEDFVKEEERNVIVLRDVCRTLLSAKIRLTELEIHKTDSVIYGTCIAMSDGSFDIAYPSDLNYCWKRFVICKELFHALMDQAKYRNMDVEAHLDSVTIAFPDNDSHADLPAVSEFLAEVAAMEFLFPYKLRVFELNCESPEFEDLSKKYRIPQVHIDKYLGAPFMENLRAHSQS